MMSYFPTLLIFSIATSIVYVDSSCVQGQVVSSKTKYGTLDTHCVFKNMKVLPGSSFKLPSPDCLDCKCTTQSMSCCGFGFHAGKAAGPPGCVAKEDACKLIFVKENNQSEICKSTKGIVSIKNKPGSRRP